MRTRRLHRMSIDDGGSGVGARVLLPIECDGTLDAALDSALESGAAERNDPRAIRKSGLTTSRWRTGAPPVLSYLGQARAPVLHGKGDCYSGTSADSCSRLCSVATLL